MHAGSARSVSLIQSPSLTGLLLADGCQDMPSVLPACREWPKGKVPGNFQKSVRLNIPTLLIPGFSDPATPPAGAERVGRSLPNGPPVPTGDREAGP
jgi:pimeloyl-ACP methyl ester carboxylesterase